ncbi:hypothetical protein L2E82_11965 [Cichorium intybus]|uniref:Uncharacterized protein n=1 Tax=Cichorium intybus TaxID=13427 RepID=A0ACB9GEY0_CICIN|nr:hypothetical protein L2E82_11965 [Cichorium intybus]
MVALCFFFHRDVLSSYKITAAPFGDKLSCSLIHSQQLLFETDQLYLLGTCMHEAFRLGLRRCKIIR